MATAPTRNEAIDRATMEMVAGSAGPGVALHPQNEAAENLYLIGRPTLKQFLSFVKDHVVHGPSSGDLVAEWKAANAVVRTLEKEEAGLADDPAIQPVDPENELLLELLKNPLVRWACRTREKIENGPLPEPPLWQVTRSPDIQRRNGVTLLVKSGVPPASPYR